MDAKKPTSRHIVIKLPKVKDKERILKNNKRKKVSYLQGSSHKTSTDLSTEILQVRRDWQEVFKVMKSRDLQPRLLYPAKLSFRIEGQIKSSPDKKKLKEFIITKPLLYDMLIMTCLRVGLFGLSLFGTLCASWTCMSIFFTRLGRFSVIISSK